MKKQELEQLESLLKKFITEYGKELTDNPYDNLTVTEIIEATWKVEYQED